MIQAKLFPFSHENGEVINRVGARPSVEEVRQLKQISAEVPIYYLKFG